MTAPVRLPETPILDLSRVRQQRARLRKVLFLCLVALVGGFGAFCAFTGTTPLQAVKVMGMGANWVGAQIRPTPPFGGQTQVNILLLGADVSFDGSGCARTDTIKFISLDLAASRISILSIPRDTWVTIPGHRNGRINGAYQYGGRTEAARIAMAKATVGGLLEELAGREIPIHHFVRIQTGGFVHLVDALGGVTLDVEKKMDYEDPSQRLFIHLTPGLQRLNGDQAMGYVRFRMDAEGDYGRIRRQDQFVRALAAQLTQPEEKQRLPRLIGPMMRMLVTDISLADMHAIKRLLTTVGMDGIHTATLPTVPTRKGRAQVVEVEDRQAAAQTVCETLEGPRPTVLVLNGSGQVGLAGEVSAVLDTEVYNVLGVGTTQQPVESSQIVATTAVTQQANALAGELGVATISTDKTTIPQVKSRPTAPLPTADITIVLGQDFHLETLASQQAQGL
jgi:LCP family protein required for cell wall assembly